jgi:hypothetical protein
MGAQPWQWGPNPPQQAIWPLNGAYSGPDATVPPPPPPAPQNQGFYLLGPKPATPYVAGANPNLDPRATFLSPQMTYQVPATPVTDAPPPPPDILLQRLANPYLPPQPDPTKATPAAPYNPYITVDYVAPPQAAVQDNRQFTTKGAVAPPPLPTNLFSFGRYQPFAGLEAYLLPQVPTVPPPGQPKTTFFRHNYRENAPNAVPPATQYLAQRGTGVGQDPLQTGKVPFDWLVHLDRLPISPMELMHVSAFKPHELTHRFVAPTIGGLPWNGANEGPLFQHYAHWTEADTRLYRLFEMLDAKSPGAGLAVNGRFPGKVNLNTLTLDDGNIFRALADAEPGNSYYGGANPDAAVDKVFVNFIKRRTPDPNGVPGPADAPLWGLATGDAPGGDALDQLPPLPPTPRGIQNTLLQPAAGGASTWDAARLLEPTQTVNNVTVPQFTHPYQRYELLTKLFSNVTTRSNVFAVWLTVGFFEVTDDTVRPVKLGAEIGKAENRNIRHRMFAIVDRTQMQVFAGTLTSKNANGITPGVREDLNAAPIPDPRTGRTWTLQAGSLLVLEPNTDKEETVMLQQDAMGLFFFALQPHPVMTPAVGRGNPGPWLRYNPHQDADVVPYVAVIE